jgi:hypothetical protein
VFIQINLDTCNPEDVEALAALVSWRKPAPQPTQFVPDVRLRPPTKLVNQTDHGTFDVEPVPLEQAIAEAHAETALAPITVIYKPAQPVAVADALAAIQSAQQRGIGIDKVRAILAAQFEGKRVTELSDEKRAEFVAALAAA